MDARKIRKVCLKLVFVVLVCFSVIEFQVFSLEVFFTIFFHLADHLVVCNGTLLLYRKGCDAPLRLCVKIVLVGLCVKIMSNF